MIIGTAVSRILGLLASQLGVRKYTEVRLSWDDLQFCMESAYRSGWQDCAAKPLELQESESPGAPFVLTMGSLTSLRRTDEKGK